MLRITIISALAVLGSIRATIYKDVETIRLDASYTTNEYSHTTRKSLDSNEIYIIIQEEITKKSGLLLCETWEYVELQQVSGVICGREGDAGGDTLPPHGGIIHGPVCRELCDALDDLADRDPPFPRPDEALGLRGQRCPLKKGSYSVPRLTMPDPLRVNFTLLPDYVLYSSGLFPIKDGATSNLENSFAYVDVIFVACKKKC